MKNILLFSFIVFMTGCVAVTSEPQSTQTDTPVVTSTGAESPSISTPATAATQLPVDESLDHVDLLNQLLFEVSSAAEAQTILDQIRTSGDTRFISGLIDVLRYQRRLELEIGQTLNSLTGQDLPPDWFAWAEWAGQNSEIESFAGYVGFKANLLAQIDPNFLRFIHSDVRIAPDSRPEEIVWGGVYVDGIPALDNPAMINPEDADYLVPEERVFGVSINGDTRAYPARFLDWHEMFNDVVGGEPVSLAY